MKKIIIALACGVLKFVNLFFRGRKLEDKVVIISRQSDTETMDIRMLRAELEKMNIPVSVLCKKISGAGYAFHMLKQMKEINSAKVIVLDSYCILASILPKKEGQKTLQMWHALGAIKKFGWQSAGNESGRSSVVAEGMNMHAGYDYFLAPSPDTEGFFREAFRSEGEALRIGLPRIDYLRREDDGTGDAIRAQYPQLGAATEAAQKPQAKGAAKQTVLYVPTFRRNAALEMQALIDSFDFDKFNLVIKKHFLDKGDYSFAREKGAIVDDKFSSLEWFSVSDKVVTDYSAISLEAAVAEKQLIIYQPDVQEYEEGNGLNMYFEKEAIGPYFAKDEAGLMEALNKDYDMARLEEFRDKYFDIELAGVTSQLAEFVAGLM